MKALVLNIIHEKCPFCSKGDVFENKRFYQLPKMNTHCSHCKRDFIGEAGYYFGAMYISYAIAVAIAISMVLFCWILLGIKSFVTILIVVMLSIALFAFKNFKWSRIIWLAILPPGDNTNFLIKQKAPKV